MWQLFALKYGEPKLEGGHQVSFINKVWVKVNIGLNLFNFKNSIFVNHLLTKIVLSFGVVNVKINIAFSLRSY